MSTFFRHPFSYPLQRVLCFILGLELFHKKEVWIVSKALITWIDTGAIRAWKITFEIAKLLKTTIRPSRVMFQYRQRFDMLWTLQTILRKLHSSFILLVYKKKVPKMLIASLHRSMYFMPQTATWNPFRAPIPAILHFVKLGFSPEKREKVWNTSTRFSMDCASFRKNVVSSAYAV